MVGRTPPVIAEAGVTRGQPAAALALPFAAGARSLAQGCPNMMKTASTQVASADRQSALNARAVQFRVVLSSPRASFPAAFARNFRLRAVNRRLSLSP